MHRVLLHIFLIFSIYSLPDIPNSWLDRPFACCKSPFVPVWRCPVYSYVGNVDVSVTEAHLQTLFDSPETKVIKVKLKNKAVRKSVSVCGVGGSRRDMERCGGCPALRVPPSPLQRRLQRDLMSDRPTRNTFRGFPWDSGSEEEQQTPLISVTKTHSSMSDKKPSPCLRCFCSLGIIGPALRIWLH